MTVNFSETVTVTAGTTISLEIGDGGGKVTYNVACNATTAASTTCSYTVIAADYDDSGVAVKSPYVLNAGTVSDAAGNNLSALTFTAPNTTTLTVNAGTPAFEWADSGSSVVTSFDFTSAYPTGLPHANSENETFTITNIGSEATTTNFTITVPNGGGCARFSLGTDTCSGSVIGINGTCTVQIIYTTKKNSNTKTCDITAEDSGYAANPGYILTGSGTTQ